jgi:GT2 family glycosyltransferase
MPKIAAIIPLYNKEPYVSRAVESVLAQTFEDFELIVIDDGSTDGGPDIVRRYADPRLRLIYQDNAGPGAARNRGIAEATARYVAFLDADDEWMPDFLLSGKRSLEQSPGCRVFVANHIRGNVTKTFLDMHPQLTIAPGVNKLSSDVTPQLVKNHVDMFAADAVIAERKVIQRQGGYFGDGCTYGEDTYLWLRVLFNEAFYMCPTPLTRVHLDCSELGHGRKTPYPIHPLVQQADTVIAGCPEDYRPLMWEVLDYYALISLRRRVNCRDYVGAQKILDRFPQTEAFWKQFLGLRLKVRILSSTTFFTR